MLRYIVSVPYGNTTSFTTPPAQVNCMSPLLREVNQAGSPFQIVATCLLVISTLSCLAETHAEEGKWESVLGQINPGEQAVVGKWNKSSSGLSVEAAQGARIVLPIEVNGEYDLRATFTRRSGIHSIGIVFVHGGHQVVYEVDAWGKHLAGFQNVQGKTIQENSTQKSNVALINGQKHTIAVEVRNDSIRGLLDDREVCAYKTDGSDLSMHEVWKLPRSNQFGLVAWDSSTEFHSIEFRQLNSSSSPSQSNVTKTTNARAETMADKLSASNQNKQTAPQSKPSSKAMLKKKVLIVIANQDFFYREYFEPRQELEQAGFRVTVAAGRKGVCRPHPNSGQFNSDGTVQADVSLSEVKADDFDAILFSGGWGASSYQFAFEGKYNEESYNGNRAIKKEVNRVINEFVSQDKYVCALCNGVSVLAWARVNNKSLLAGKKVVAPVREAPPGIYNGRRDQPSCRWHAEANGATLNPPGALGQPGTNSDDVLVDGKVITGEDDPSAREMGRRIVSVLSS